MDTVDDDARQSFLGQSRTYTDEQLQFIVSTYTEYEKERHKVKLVAFMKNLRRQWQKQTWLTQPPCRKTVEDILLANGLRKLQPQISKRPKYYEPIRKYFPHVQSVLDGKEVIVQVNENLYKFVMEYSKDIATDAIGGFQIDKTENADLVKGAFNAHVKNHRQPLSALVDNGKGNAKAAIDLGSEGTLFIKAFPYRPETKGHIEGEFGLFERTVSHIHITGKNETELALSILDHLSRVYIRLRNSQGRCSVCPFTPEKLMQANLDQLEAKTAYRALKIEQAKKEQDQEKRLKISQIHHDLLDSIIKEHRLTGNTFRFKKSLRWVELSSIRQAEQIFATYSHKDIFDESKRTMAYFSAIARNLQQQKDQQRKQETARRRYGLDQKSKSDREKIKLELLIKKEQQCMEKEPNLRIVNAIDAHTNLPVDFRKSVKLYKNHIDDAVQSLLRKSKQRQIALIEKIKKEIMKLRHLSINEQYDWINYVNERVECLLNYNEKVVTPKS